MTTDLHLQTTFWFPDPGVCPISQDFVAPVLVREEPEHDGRPKSYLGRVNWRLLYYMKLQSLVQSQPSFHKPFSQIIV